MGPDGRVFLLHRQTAVVQKRNGTITDHNGRRLVALSVLVGVVIDLGWTDGCPGGVGFLGSWLVGRWGTLEKSPDDARRGNADQDTGNEAQHGVLEGAGAANGVAERPVAENHPTDEADADVAG